jgi:hypothetical protein
MLSRDICQSCRKERGRGHRYKLAIKERMYWICPAKIFGNYYVGVNDRVNGKCLKMFEQLVYLSVNIDKIAGANNAKP